uniref:Integrase catalytic domain-containing protein n=1 Tax=Strigamia maritima TaxID=126957 RepID=T1IVZ5_STRMM
MDLWGPCKVVTAGGAKYLFCIVDDMSRYTWIIPLETKDETFGIFKSFHHRVEKQTGKKVVAIRTDRGGEFVSKEFEDYLNGMGIRIQRTNPASPEMNGIAERINRTIHDGVRTVLDDSQLDEDLWAELALTVTHLKNRFPHSSIGNQISYVLFRKRKLVLTYLKIPGLLAFVHFPQHKRESKHSPRAWKGIVLGYAMSTRGYRI